MGSLTIVSLHKFFLLLELIWGRALMMSINSWISGAILLDNSMTESRMGSETQLIDVTY
jgi:hypothetical protein